MILERRAEGVIVIASWIFEETNLLADIEKNNVPIVIVGRDLTNRRVSSLLVDNEAGGALALRHLIELGHRRIAIIRGPEELFDSEPRWAGVQRVAAGSRNPDRPRLVFQLPNLTGSTSGFEGGLRFAKEMLASRPALHCRARIRRPDGAGCGAWIERSRIESAGGLFGGWLRRRAARSGSDARHHHDPPALEGDGATGRRSGRWRRSMPANRARQKPVICYKAPPELVVRMSTSRRAPAVATCQL